MPKALLDKVIAASKFNQGFATTEYLEAAMLDQRLHQLPSDKIPAASGVMAFEAQALKADGFDYAPVPPRYKTPYFSLAEVRGLVARRHRRVVESVSLQGLRLERHHAGGGGDLVGRQLVQALVEHRRFQVLGGGEALVELGRGDHLVQQRLRHRL